jgi:hypothetical protein
MLNQLDENHPFFKKLDQCLIVYKLQNGFPGILRRLVWFHYTNNEILYNHTNLVVR